MPAPLPERIIRTEGQKDLLIRYASTVSQITLAATVGAPVARPQELQLWVFITGVAATAVLFGIAYYLAGREIIV